ncbi:hypothetical protein CHS0354_006810 [Potamilus streckersoni]|uniref:Uncharacterized protein n=1 Tax=Potamilus streckersoni TaxID=2493646 RepID=A0AAE0TEC7_9BIVA|nr:hypothetical protein CHS0354_006810 [Potamilus streckersoni]
MNPIKCFVPAQSGAVFTSSHEVARVFDRRHDNVLRDIRNLQIPEDFRVLNFEENCTTAELRPNVWRETPYYNIRKDGMLVLVMGYTEAKAMKMKLAYIAAFNAMEAELSRMKALPPAGIDWREILKAAFPGLSEERRKTLEMVLPMLKQQGLSQRRAATATGLYQGKLKPKERMKTQEFSKRDYDRKRDSDRKDYSAKAQAQWLKDYRNAYRRPGRAKKAWAALKNLFRHAWKALTETQPKTYDTHDYRK